VVALNATSAPTRIALRYFNSSPEVIRLAVLMYVKYPLSLRNVECPSSEHLAQLAA